jgi:hypothetical protein
MSSSCSELNCRQYASNQCKGCVTLPNGAWCVGQANSGTQLGYGNAPTYYQQTFTPPKDNTSNDPTLYCTPVFSVSSGSAMFCNTTGLDSSNPVSATLYSDPTQCYGTNMLALK